MIIIRGISIELYILEHNWMKKIFGEIFDLHDFLIDQVFLVFFYFIYNNINIITIFVLYTVICIYIFFLQKSNRDRGYINEILNLYFFSFYYY